MKYELCQRLKYESYKYVVLVYKLPKVRDRYKNIRRTLAHFIEINSKDCFFPTVFSSYKIIVGTPTKKYATHTCTFKVVEIAKKKILHEQTHPFHLRMQVMLEIFLLTYRDENGLEHDHVKKTFTMVLKYRAHRKSSKKT